MQTPEIQLAPTAVPVSLPPAHWSATLVRIANAMALLSELMHHLNFLPQLDSEENCAGAQSSLVSCS
jgi:hypothetical protein